MIIRLRKVKNKKSKKIFLFFCFFVFLFFPSILVIERICYLVFLASAFSLACATNASRFSSPNMIQKPSR